ncbi:hrp65 protein-like isoform X1 [Bradysia coprophila]|uniref:hrp65 protein-like isoform X1 n=1 Tax=Bradysia coprophila TaxID=38358 RepID=UPI00187D8A37|nr:hrp65 protein-like isoform X1 [Bradysia coprophila]
MEDPADEWNYIDVMSKSTPDDSENTVEDVDKIVEQQPSDTVESGQSKNGGTTSKSKSGQHRNRNKKDKSDDKGDNGQKQPTKQSNGEENPRRNQQNNANKHRGEDYMIIHKIKNLRGPFFDIAPIDHEEIKFSGRNRLYVGNLSNDITEENLKQLFKPYGKIDDIFLNTDKTFCFVKVDYRANAEKAKLELDGSMHMNRTIRVRFAPNATTIKVKNLSSHISNELLYRSFEVFGKVERAVIIVDDRGKPAGEGIVEFARKSSAMSAIRFCSEKSYFLTSSLRPCIVELLEHIDDTDGVPERTFNKKHNDFNLARQLGPRIAYDGSFEHEYALRWKQLFDLYKQKQEALKQEMMIEADKLEAQMEYARFEHETEVLRQRLRMREGGNSRRNDYELKEQLQRQMQYNMAQHIGLREAELLQRQQQNAILMQVAQVQQLFSMLDSQNGQPMGHGSGNATGYNHGRNQANNDKGKPFRKKSNQNGAVKR